MPAFEIMDQCLLVLHESLDIETIFLQHQRSMIHSYVMREDDIVGALFVEFERFMDMIGYEDDDQIRIMLFYGLEQDHILIEGLYRTYDHLAFLEIQFLEEIAIADVAVDAWDLIFLEMGYDSWILIDDENVLMRLMKHFIEIASESSVSEDGYLIIFPIDFPVFLIPHSWKQRQDRFEEMIDPFSIDYEIT